MAYFNVQLTSVSKCQCFIIPLLNRKGNCNLFPVLFTSFVPSGRAAVSGRDFRRHILNFLTPAPAHLLIDPVVRSPHLLRGYEKINKKLKGVGLWAEIWTTNLLNTKHGWCPSTDTFRRKAQDNGLRLFLRHWPYSCVRKWVHVCKTTRWRTVGHRVRERKQNLPNSMTQHGCTW